MDQSLVLADYRLLRATGKAYSNKLVKSLHRDDLLTAARRLGMLRGEKTIYFETEDESSVLMDYAIHEIFRDGQNAIGRMLREDPPPEESPEMRVLRSLQKARYATLQVREVMPGFGVVAHDGLRNAEITLVDMGFSQTAIPGAAFATRIHSPDENWWMTTGASLPITEEATDLIETAIEDYTDRRGKSPAGADLTLLITRACIKAGASQFISYADPGAAVKPRSASPAQIAAPLRARAKVGRNDPCPCGSGKKYKKCCGG